MEESIQRIEIDDAAPVDFEANKEYNRTINDHSDLVTNLAIRDNYILVRLFKYEQESLSEGGIIMEDLEGYMTEGGQARARIKATPYSRRGVIVKVGHVPYSDAWVKLLEPGAVVHLPENKLKEFHVDKSKKVDQGHGYFMVNAATIEAIETNTVN